MARTKIKIKRKNEKKPDLGVKAGVYAGLLMAAVAMLNAWGSGLGIWLPVRNISAMFMGVEALYGGFLVILLGLIVHVVTSAAFGLLFGLFTMKVQHTATRVAYGLIYGILLWGIMTYLVLPRFNEIMAERVSVMAGWWFAYHLIYGFFLGLFIGPQRSRQKIPRLTETTNRKGAAPEGLTHPVLSKK